MMVEIHRRGPWRSFEAVEFGTREWPPDPNQIASGEPEAVQTAKWLYCLPAALFGGSADLMLPVSDTRSRACSTRFLEATTARWELAS